MSDLVNQLSTHTGLSPEQIQKGLVALLNFLRKEIGDESFDEIKTAVPEASALLSEFEAAPATEATAPARGGLFDIFSGLAGKFLGGKTGAGAELLATLTKLGFKPDQIQAFLMKALELIKTHLPPELLEKLLTALPVMAKFLTEGAK